MFVRFLVQGNEGIELRQMGVATAVRVIAPFAEAANADVRRRRGQIRVGQVTLEILEPVAMIDLGVGQGQFLPPGRRIVRG